MGLRDLFHACPACGREAGLADRRGDALCRTCGAVLRRDRSGTIAVRLPDGRLERRTAGDWLDAIPLPDPLPEHETMGPEAAVLRVASQARPYRAGGELIGWGERFGSKRRGRVRLTPDALVFEPERGTRRVWPFERLTAVQPTSSALQVRARGELVAQIKFRDSSVRLWEHRIQQRLRALYRRKGRGDIVEFQPRITTR